ncbi:Uncharacterized protein Fot_22831 [Forsythia ovata]|uniref:Uncharacterized protein n=1 Tax=Forsythia ovata TaxID=205694 RepID=A0ABD1UYV3_9LAMI
MAADWRLLEVVSLTDHLHTIPIIHGFKNFMHEKETLPTPTATDELTGFGQDLSYCSSSSSSIKRDYEGASETPQQKLDLDGLTPFEKNFYVESPSMAAMSESEVEEYRRHREITVEGKDVPKPMKAFSGCWVSRYNLAKFHFHA